MPEDVACVTKPKLGRIMLARALDVGTPGPWVVADSVDGGDHALRRWIAARRRGDVLAVTSGQRLGLARVDSRADDVPPDRTGPQPRSIGEGAKGARLYGWAYLP